MATCKAIIGGQGGEAPRGCRAHAVKGTDFCLAHSGRESQELVGFGGSQPGAGRPKLATPIQVAQRLVEDNVTVLLAPSFRTLGFEIVNEGNGPELRRLEGGGAKLFGTQQSTGEIRVSEHDDLGAMQNAAEKLFDRVYGKPRQMTEISGPDGSPVQVASTFDLSRLTVGEKRELLELLEKAG
jgi:hypothetical protein